MGQAQLRAVADRLVRSSSTMYELGTFFSLNLWTFSIARIIKFSIWLTSYSVNELHKFSLSMFNVMLRILYVVNTNVFHTLPLFNLSVAY